MDDLQIYVLFYSISGISGEWMGDNRRPCAMELFLVEIFPPVLGNKSKTARSIGQHVTH